MKDKAYESLFFLEKKKTLGKRKIEVKLGKENER